MKTNSITYIAYFFIMVLAVNSYATQYKVEEINTELSTPWAITVLPDDTVLVTERAGQLRHLVDGELSEPIAGVPPVYFAGQGGLLDIVLAPDFSTNQRIFLSLASGDAKNNQLSIVSAVWDRERNALEDVKTIFSVTPSKDTPVHYGARMALMPDNTLLLASGDGFDYRESAQLQNSLLGKIIRINLDGSAPGNNPFAVTADKASLAKYIWTRGHRNPQALFYDTESDLVFSHEHGPAGGDEINIIEPGKNYGWPVITNGRDYSGASISPFKQYPGMEQPLFDWTPSVAPSDMIFYRGKAFSELTDHLLVTTLKSREVQILSFSKGEIALKNSILNDINERFRAIEQDQNGNILLLTDSGKLLKLIAEQ